MTASQLIPRAESWIGFILKVSAVIGLLWWVPPFVLENKRVAGALAAATGADMALSTAKSALELAQAQNDTITTFRGQIVDVSQAIATAQTQIAATTTSLASVATKLDDTTARLVELDGRQKRATAAPMTIIDPGHIDDVAPGHRTRVTIRMSQERDCGRADHWAIRFRDSEGLSGVFEDLSVNDGEGFGPRFDPAPGSFRDYSFTAALPGDDLFSAGVAQARVIVSGWQLCPDADEARSPSIPFTILPSAKQRSSVR